MGFFLMWQKVQVEDKMRDTFYVLKPESRKPNNTDTYDYNVDSTNLLINNPNIFYYN